MTVILSYQITGNSVRLVSTILHMVTQDEQEHIFPDFSHKSLITFKFSHFSRLSRWVPLPPRVP